MATTTVQETAGLQAVPPVSTAGKRPAGRPAKPVAPPPSAEEGSFWEWLDAIPRDDWQNLICYVWRTGPFLNLNQTSGKPISLEKVAQPFDVTYILKTHGSGGYRFDVCYSQPNGTEKKRIRQAYETIIDMRYPPKVPAGEWLDDPRNKEWAWCKPQLEADEKQRVVDAAAKINGNQPPQQSRTEEFSEMLDLVKKMSPDESKGTTGLILELIKMNDPSKALGLMKEMQSLQTPAAPAQQESPLMMMFMKHLMDEVKASRAAPPVDPLETALKFIGVLKDKAADLGFGNPGGVVKMDATTAAVTAGGEILGKVVDGLGGSLPSILQAWQHAKTVELHIAQVNAQKGMDPRRPWEFNGTTGNPPAQQQTPQAPYVPPAAAAPVPPPPPGPMTAQALFLKYSPLLNSHFASLTHLFKHSDGFEMQRTVIDEDGRKTFDAFRADATVDLLMQVVGASQQLREIFTPADKAKLFFTELLSDPDAPADGDEDDEEPAGAEVVS